MQKRQVAGLFIVSLCLWTVGVGLLPLLPLYAQILGADPAMIGYYLAFCYLAIAIGATAAGWVSDRLQRRKLPMFIFSLVSIPICWLIGRASGIIVLSLLTGILWFCGGFLLAGIGILTGLFAPEKERGKYFGIIALTSGLGTMLGGFTAGTIVDHWGYTTLFDILAGVLAIQPFALLFIEDKQTSAPLKTADRVRSVGLGRPFYLLFSATVLSAITGFIALLIRSLVMNGHGFSASDISSTGAVGGLITIPLPFIIGMLSDNLGRKTFMLAGYLAAAASVAVLGISTALWHFWSYAILGSISGSLTSVGSALATDILPPSGLGKGLGLFSASGWIGGIFGFAFAGLAFKYLGEFTTIWIAIGLSLVAMALIATIRPLRKLENVLSAIGPVSKETEAES